MKTQNSIEYHNSQEKITLKEFFIKIGEWGRYLLRKWLILLILLVIGGGLGFLYAVLKKPTYVASSTFVLYESPNSGAGSLGQYAGLAALVGINLGQGEGGIFQGDNIIELYKSRSMIEKTLLSEVEIAKKKQLLIDYYLDFNKLRKDWSTNPALASLHFRLKKGETFSRLQDSIMGLVVRDINKHYLYVGKPDKLLSIIKVEVKASDEAFALLFNDQIVENVNDFYVQSKTKKLQENIAILEHQADSVKAITEKAIYSQASTMDATAYLNPTRQVLRTSIQRGMLSVETNKAILSELIKNIEMTKMVLLKETPLIQVIDRPVAPLVNSNLSAFLTMLLGAFVFLFFGVIYLLIKKIVTD
jgi:hypothetical protein